MIVAPTAYTTLPGTPEFDAAILTMGYAYSLEQRTARREVLFGLHVAPLDVRDEAYFSARYSGETTSFHRAVAHREIADRHGVSITELRAIKATV